MKRPGILVKVLVRPELQSIDKNTGNDVIGILTRLLHQADMASMQIAHRRNKGNRFAILTNLG